MRDERRARNRAQLGREGRTEREDVMHDDVGAHLLDERERVARGVDDRLVEVEGPGPAIGIGGWDRERAVLGRGRERQPLGLHMLAPPTPRLKRYVVPARAQRAAQGDHGKRVPGIAEGAEQHPQGRAG
ncbi:MAG TPA: hypothetical protein VMU55_06285 [Solirubrobacteraceae bacterium]|nr:hypothetical protein [Solirubrobacteraceae bacterium]